MRRGAAKLILLILVVAIAVVGIVAMSANHPPVVRNVVLISIDTCRADHLSCYGFNRPTSPNIDAIAQEGVMFTKAQTTNPLTLPAHSTMMTGTIPPVHGVLTNQGHRLGDSNLTLAEVLQENAYQTGAVVGAFPMEGRFGISQGFDTYDDDFGSDPKTGFLNERLAGDVSNAAMEWLDQRADNETPFFLFVHYYDPHQRFEPPEPFATKYPKDKYSGEIAYTDHCIGKVIEKLKALGLYDSTAIIITSDHGESLGDHLEVSHGFFIYQPTIHIPLVIRTPDCDQGRQVKAPVSLVDVMPTILGLLNQDTPTHVQGIDLSACIYGGDEPAEDRYLYSDSWYPAKLECSPLRGLRQGDWRYIWSVRPELYDLKTDPGELNNVLDDNPTVAQRLDHELKDTLAHAEQMRARDNEGNLDQDQHSLQRLQSLGYVGGGEVESLGEIAEGMNDPKDFIIVLNQYTMAMTHKAENRLEDAKAECLKIMAAQPRMLHAHLLLGELATAQGDFANADKHYNDVLAFATTATQPDTLRYEMAVAHVNLGNLTSRSGDTVGAQRHFETVLELDPGNFDGLMGLAQVFTATDKVSAATSTYESILTSHPRHSEALYELGKLQLATSDLTKARESFERIIQIEPRHTRALRRLASTVAQQGDVAAALQHLQQALQYQPDSVGTNNDLALLLATTSEPTIRDTEQAIRMAQRSAELSQRGRARVLDTLAISLAAAGQFDHAIKVAKEAVDLAEENAQTELAGEIRARLRLYHQSLPYDPTPIPQRSQQ